MQRLAHRARARASVADCLIVTLIEIRSPFEQPIDPVARTSEPP